MESLVERVSLSLNKPLFHGTNERYWDKFMNTFKLEPCSMPAKFWSDSVMESLGFAVVSAKNFDSKPLCVCIPALTPCYLKKTGENGVSTWYTRLETPFIDFKNAGLLEVYRRNDLHELVAKYGSGFDHVAFKHYLI